MAGAAALWMVNPAISLTPLAAEYRTALSIDYAPMLVEAALGGLLIALLVSWVLVHFLGGSLLGSRCRDPWPPASSFSLALTVLIDIPAKFFTSSTNDPWRYFVIAIAHPGCFGCAHAPTSLVSVCTEGPPSVGASTGDWSRTPTMIR